MKSQGEARDFVGSPMRSSGSPQMEAPSIEGRCSSYTVPPSQRRAARGLWHPGPTRKPGALALLLKHPGGF